MKIEVGISTLLHPAAAHCEVEHTVAKTTQTPENTQTLREQSMLSIMHVSGEVPRGGGQSGGRSDTSQGSDWQVTECKANPQVRGGDGHGGAHMEYDWMLR